MKLKIKRVYEKPGGRAEFRVLVDRLWPRGLTKRSAAIGLWMKEAAPSNELRRWFHADKAGRLTEFKKRYRKELAGSPVLARLERVFKKKSGAVLVTAVKDIKRSHVPVLMKALHTRHSPIGRD